MTENEENDNEVSILKESVGKDGKTVTKYITATVYEKTDKEYYVGTTLFKVGDYILKKDSSKNIRYPEPEVCRAFIISTKVTPFSGKSRLLMRMRNIVL